MPTRCGFSTSLSHLKDHTARDAGGMAGFVMATGELSSGEIMRLAVRRALIEGGFVDCVVTLTGKLFANTQIHCALWFLSKNRAGGHGFRERKNEVLFIKGDKLATLFPGSKKQKQLAAEEIEQIACVYRQFRKTGAPATVPGYCAVASVERIRECPATSSPLPCWCARMVPSRRRRGENCAEAITPSSRCWSESASMRSWMAASSSPRWSRA